MRIYLENQLEDLRERGGRDIFLLTIPGQVQSSSLSRRELQKLYYFIFSNLPQAIQDREADETQA